MNNSDRARILEIRSPRLLSQVFTQQPRSKPVPVKQILVKRKLQLLVRSKSNRYDGFLTLLFSECFHGKEPIAGGTHVKVCYTFSVNVQHH